ncbi:S9 family peptidase [Prevotella lacticifex]|uniref:Prolyl oligopeptidase n=1 Tax=Prevotella lacticifex TaxID=2854755 RepID=A0A9R1C9T9_9BACT|nr:S9 family peptidase [Prevotella lacticifex]GJG35418.1 prolyl oligopeptidase [Prevotella lacticifex]GJG39532.1 prolyl oligopeptidase [Prevotella lacticifex]GJG41786.1 prolyl oligopeptidase [Prevotella lacticifex]GJG45889.1 prolyl oligopeptidase [Prevotella lacticifex]GJG48137.1 prolyl oligopeptidase [Prevotella lacticifex]
MKKTIITIAAALFMGGSVLQAQQVKIGKNNIKLTHDTMTPEALWAMGRIGTTAASPDGKKIVYQVGYYSVEENKGHQMLFVMDANGKNVKQLTVSDNSETDPSWIDNNTIAFLSDGQIWKMNAEGTNRKKLTSDKIEIEGYKFSPDRKKVVIIKSLPYYGSIKKNPSDLPKATGRLITDMNYRHWDHYVETIPHPFVANVNGDNIDAGTDILEGEPYESPMAPFGGIEQIDWSRDSKSVAYTCRKKEGVRYAISTDADIYLYDTETHKTKNLCKDDADKTLIAEWAKADSSIDATKSMRGQAIDSEKFQSLNVGYDVNPKFSPDGKYVAWQSMAHNGYESDLNRLCIYDLTKHTKFYATDARNFDTNVDDYCWAPDSKSLYITGVWHATERIWNVSIKGGKVKQITDDGYYDFGSVQMLNGKQLLTTRHSMLHPDDIFVVTPSKNEKKALVEQITDENKNIFDQLASATVEQRWVKTTDGKEELVWVILPPHFDKTKKYPTLLYCEGGPQSPVSQFWSYRWNFSIMAAHGYVIIAPNRRGLPGFGSEWNEEVSRDWTGQCMDDYLSAIDDAVKNLPYVDKDRLGAVGASFGGFSVYYLAGHHNKRFKCFIAHDGAFNLESMYTDTEEAWFSNWEYDDAYWNKDQTAAARKTYENSPHKAVNNWDTPILCIHGEKDYRINANQGMGAFNAARMKGIPAELLLFPDENHWVLKPQNGILWQRTFFEWLDRWLKK